MSRVVWSAALICVSNVYPYSAVCRFPASFGGCATTGEQYSGNPSSSGQFVEGKNKDWVAELRRDRPKLHCHPWLCYFPIPSHSLTNRSVTSFPSFACLYSRLSIILYHFANRSFFLSASAFFSSLYWRVPASIPLLYAALFQSFCMTPGLR